MEITLIKKIVKHPLVRKTIHPIVQKYDPYKDPDSHIEEEDFGRGLPDYDVERDLGDDEDIWDYLVYFKYLFNIVFIVCPMAFFEVIFIAYNLFFNIAWNDWWANGNIWLLVNTFYLIW